MTEIPTQYELIVAGRKIDNRTIEARHFRTIAGDLQIQLGRSPLASERILITNAAMLAMLCDQAVADMLEGKTVDNENYRRNVAQLGQILIKLGLAKKSRDITKSDSAHADIFGAALIEANEK